MAIFSPDRYSRLSSVRVNVVVATLAMASSEPPGHASYAGVAMSPAAMPNGIPWQRPGRNVKSRRFSMCTVRSLLLAIVLMPIALSVHGELTVTYGDPDRFTDMADSNTDPRHA